MSIIKKWALATFLLCFAVIIAGGIVRTTQSGMGCPDWPKCFGKWIPPTNAAELPADFEKYLSKQDIDHSFNAWHTWIEYVNRLLGVLLGVFALIQVALMIRFRKSHRMAFRTALAFLITVIITGLFGAIVVKYNLAHLSISVHLFFAILLVQIQLALVLLLQQRLQCINVTAKAKNQLLIFLLLLIFHSVLGTMVRMHVDDVSKLLNYTQRSLWLQSNPLTFLIHRSFSWALLLGGLWVVWSNRKLKPMFIQFKWLEFTLLLNMTVGIILYYAHMPAWAQPIHLLLAAVAITQTTALLLQTKRSPLFKA
jgi:cytochrome c oxidase assembly protein subunit 15